MSPEEEQIDHLNDELRRLIHRFKLEYDLTIEAIIGVMEFVKQELLECGIEGYFEIDILDDEEDNDEETCS